MGGRSVREERFVFLPFFTSFPPLLESLFTDLLRILAASAANGTLILLVSPRSNPYKDLLPTLNNIENRFNRRLGYPIQLLTDGALPAPEIIERTTYITGGKAKWGASILHSLLPLPSLPCSPS